MGMAVVMLGVMAGVTGCVSPRGVVAEAEPLIKPPIVVAKKPLAPQPESTPVKPIESNRALREKAANLIDAGDNWLKLGDTTKASAAYQQSQDIFKRLAVANPTNTEAQRNVSVNYSRIAEVHLTQNKLPAALAGYQQALAIDEKLLTQDPRNHTLQEDLASGQSKIDEIKRWLKK